MICFGDDVDYLVRVIKLKLDGAFPKRGSYGSI